MSTTVSGDVRVVVNIYQLAGFMVAVAFVAGCELVNFLDARLTFLRLRKSNLNGGYLILALTHVYAGAARLAMALLMLFAAVLALYNQVHLVIWPMLAMVALMGLDTVQFRRYRNRSVKAERAAEGLRSE